MGESWGPQASPVLPSCGVSKCGVVRGHWHSSPTRRHLEAVAAAVTGPVIAAWSSRDCPLRREAAALATAATAHGGRVVVFVRCTSPLFVPCSRRRLERESRGPGRAAVTGGTRHNGRATEPAEPQSPASLSRQHQHMQVHAGDLYLVYAVSYCASVGGTGRRSMATEESIRGSQMNRQK